MIAIKLYYLYKIFGGNTGEAHCISYYIYGYNKQGACNIIISISAGPTEEP